MKKYILTTFSSPVKGKETEYNKWYDEIHCEDLLKIPGFQTAQRFRPSGGLSPDGSQYLAIYEIETEDIAGVMQSIQDGSYEIRSSDAIDVLSITMQVYDLMGNKMIS